MYLIIIAAQISSKSVPFVINVSLNVMMNPGIHESALLRLKPEELEKEILFLRGKLVTLQVYDSNCDSNVSLQF